MTNKQIKKLAGLSYIKNNLDHKTVSKIASQLDRKSLKSYIKALKNIEKANTVSLFTSNAGGKQEIESLIKKVFSNKKIIVKQDDLLIAGIRVIDNDDVYDFNLRNTLENLVQYISH